MKKVQEERQVTKDSFNALEEQKFSNCHQHLHKVASHKTTLTSSLLKGLALLPMNPGLRKHTQQKLAELLEWFSK